MIKDLIGKIIIIGGYNFIEGRIAQNNVKLLDVDNNVLKIEVVDGNIIYKPLYSITSIEISDKENIEKFYRYAREIKENPNFTGDDNEFVEDKGYKFIKKKKR